MSSGGALDAQFAATLVGTTASPGLGFTLMAETVTYTKVGAPGVTPVDTVVLASRVPTPDMVEREGDEKTKWLLSSTDATAPTEGDRVTDSTGLVWVVVRVAPELGGLFELTAVHAQEG